MVAELKSHFDAWSKCIGMERSVISIVEKVQGTGNDTVVCCVDKERPNLHKKFIKRLFKPSVRTCLEARSFGLRKHSGERQFCSSFYTLESKEAAEGRFCEIQWRVG